MKNRIAAGTLALVAGMAIGWFAASEGKTSASPDKPDSAQVLRMLVEAGKIIDPDQRVLAVRAAFAHCNAAEIEALEDPVTKLATRRPDMNLREEFLYRWGELAPQKALASLGPGALASERVTVLTAWGRTDPHGAAESFPPAGMQRSDDFDAAARAVLDGIAEADAVAAIRFADRFAMADLTRLEFKISPFPSNPSGMPSGSYQEAIDHWIRHDSSGAFEVMISLKSIEVREQALTELFFGSWPDQDPEAAHAAATRLLEAAQRDGDSNVPLQRIELLGTLLKIHGERDGPSAYAQALGFSDPDQRLAAVQAALGGWAGAQNNHLPAVAEFVAMRLHSDTVPPAEAAVLVHAAEWTARWLTESGKNDEGLVQAAAWMENLPAGNARDAGARGIVSAFRWVPEQEKKLEQWAIALPRSHHRDIAIVACLTKISEHEPARALDMAATIDDPALRAEALAHVAARFISTEDAGTRAFNLTRWMRENPILAEELRAARPQD